MSREFVFFLPIPHATYNIQYPIQHSTCNIRHTEDFFLVVYQPISSLIQCLNSSRSESDNLLRLVKGYLRANGHDYSTDEKPSHGFPMGPSSLSANRSPKPIDSIGMVTSSTLDWFSSVIRLHGFSVLLALNCAVCHFRRFVSTFLLPPLRWLIIWTSCIYIEGYGGPWFGLPSTFPVNIPFPRDDLPILFTQLDCIKYAIGMTFSRWNSSKMHPLHKDYTLRRLPIKLDKRLLRFTLHLWWNLGLTLCTFIMMLKELNTSFYPWSLMYLMPESSEQAKQWPCFNWVSANWVSSYLSNTKWWSS